MSINAASASPLGTTSVIRVSSTASNTSNTSESIEISEQERQQIQKLKSRDRVVRAHEAAHLAAGAGIVRGGANFSFQRGPDGVQYAVGGEVKIDASKVFGDPQATLEKAQKVRAAALAPAQPSTQDRTIAAKAAQMSIEARAEISQQINNENDEVKPTIVSSFSKEQADANELTGNLLDLTA